MHEACTLSAPFCVMWSYKGTRAVPSKTMRNRPHAEANIDCAPFAAPVSRARQKAAAGAPAAGVGRESESKALRRHWSTSSKDFLRATTCASSPSRDSGTGSEGCASSSTGSPAAAGCSYLYLPIEKALQEYRRAFQQRTLRRAVDDDYECTHKATRSCRFDDPTTNHEDPTTLYGHSSLPLGIDNFKHVACAQRGDYNGIDASKRVTWANDEVVGTRKRVGHAKSVTWSQWVQVYEIANVLDTPWHR